MNFIKLESGKSVLGKEISAFKCDFHAKNYIYLIAGVHGDEIEGVHVLKELFSWIKENKSLTLPFLIVPTVNVDGYAKAQRTNAKGVDLNRNMSTSSWDATFTEAKNNPGVSALSEPENLFLVSLFERFPPCFILSFHSWKPILNYNGDCKDIANFIAKFNKYPSECSIGYPTPGSLGEYGPSLLNAPVLTYELPPHNENLSLSSIWQENKEGLYALLSGDFLKKKFQL